MEDWMIYEKMLHDVFQQPGAYPYPFGSASLDWLYKATEEEGLNIEKLLYAATCVCMQS